MNTTKLFMLVILLVLLTNMEAWRRRRRRRRRTCLPVACAYTWSAWTACNCLGKRTRTPRITRNPICGGTACPSSQQSECTRDCNEDGGERHISACSELSPDDQSGLYQIRISSGDEYTVYCEMGINGGGYTFIPREILSKLSEKDIDVFFQKKSDVLLRISRPDGSQPYTVISPTTGKLKLQLSKHDNEPAPVNQPLLSSPFIYLNTLPATIAKNQLKIGFKSNDKSIVYTNCDKSGNNYFALFSNPREKMVSNYHITNLVYERRGVAVDWRKSSIIPPSGSRIPLNFFLFTEMHYGGCGCYTSSDRWLQATSPALGTAIGLR